MIGRAMVALALLLAGLLAVLDVGGTVADVAGLLAIVAALSTFSRAVFRIADTEFGKVNRESDAGG